LDEPYSAVPVCYLPPEQARVSVELAVDVLDAQPVVDGGHEQVAELPFIATRVV
jgi:hypothetical protein